MNSRPRNSRLWFLGEGLLTGALAGAGEARCALPPVHPPLLSMEEWWRVWTLAVLLGAAWGLAMGIFVALSARRAAGSGRSG